MKGFFLPNRKIFSCLIVFSVLISNACGGGGGGGRGGASSRAP